MKLLLDDSDLLNIKPLDFSSSDKAVIKKSGSGGLGRSESIPELTREIAALDVVLENGTQTELAKIHGISQESISNATRGKTCGQSAVDEDLKAKVDAAKYGIIDTATSKLMSTLNLFSPEALDQKDLPRAAAAMAGIVEKVSGRSKENENQNVHLHFYAPRQKKESSYEVIEVS